jgi:hypothetical protein
MEELKEKETLVKQQLEEIQSQEEVLWRKRYGIQWLQEGEGNTNFFHRAMIQQRHINYITHLVTEQGQMLQKLEHLEQELVSYYQELLSELPGDRSPAIEKITQHILDIINQEHNEALLRPITIEEVDLAR